MRTYIVCPNCNLNEPLTEYGKIYTEVLTIEYGKIYTKVLICPNCGILFQRKGLNK